MMIGTTMVARTSVAPAMSSDSAPTRGSVRRSSLRTARPVTHASPPRPLPRWMSACSSRGAVGEAEHHHVARGIAQRETAQVRTGQRARGLEHAREHARGVERGVDHRGDLRELFRLAPAAVASS